MAVTLYHRALDRSVTVSEGHARALRRRGWTDPPAPHQQAPRANAALGQPLDRPQIATPGVSETHVPEGDDPTPIKED